MVVGGGGWVVCKPIIVFSFEQAEQKASHSHFQLHTTLPVPYWDGHIYANFAEPIWIQNLCLWNQRALFATLDYF